MADPAPRRPSRMRYLFIFVLGVFVGRLASSQFSGGALDAVDLLMVAGLAITIVWAWRSWARETFERRRRDALERQQRRARSAKRKDGA